MAIENEEQTNTETEVEESLLSVEKPDVKEESNAEEVKTEEVKTDDSEDGLLSDKSENEEKKDEEDNEEESKEEDIPEEYDNEGLELPEDMELNADLLGRFDEYAKGKKLTQSDRNDYVKFFAEAQAEAAAKHITETREMRKGWVKDIKKDPKWKETVGYAKRVISELGAEDASVFTDSTSWLSDYPPLVKLLANAGRKISEDSFDDAGNGGGESSSPDRAKSLYPNMN